MRTVNKVSVKFSQHLSYIGPSRKDKAGVVKAGKLITFDNEMEFRDETSREITAENVASWAVAKIGHALKGMRLQGKTGFKVSKPIVMELTINSKVVEVSYWKMALNLDRIEKIILRSPEQVANAFTSYGKNIADSTTASGFKFLKEAANGKLVVASHVKNALPPINANTIEEIAAEKPALPVAENVPALEN